MRNVVLGLHVVLRSLKPGCNPPTMLLNVSRPAGAFSKSRQKSRSRIPVCPPIIPRPRWELVGDCATRYGFRIGGASAIGPGRLVSVEKLQGTDPCHAVFFSIYLYMDPYRQKKNPSRVYMEICLCGRKNLEVNHGSRKKSQNML